MYLESQFIPYEQALALKELGFDEPCFATYRQWDGREPYLHLDTDIEADNFTIECDAPLYQQAFRWFRERHNYHHEIVFNKNRDLPYTYVVDTPKSYLRSPFHKTYEEAELECLKKLIQIVKLKQ